MKAILAIARVEVLRNWKLIALPLSAVLGVLVLALMGTKQSDQTTSGSIMGILILFELPLAGVPAVVLGLNLFGPDIRQKRLAFFLARPCAPWQLYFGRMLGASFITSVGWLGAGVLLPFMGVTGSFDGGGMPKRTDAILAALILAGLLVFMNSVAMILAANAPAWFVADAVVGVSVLMAAIWSLQQALRLGDFDLMTSEVSALLPVALAGLFFAGLAYLAFGRGDGPRGHRAHSITLWSFGVASLLGLAAHRDYEWSRSLGSIFPPGIAKAVGPDQALVTVFEKWRRSSFLLNTRTGEARRISGFVDVTTKVEPKSGLLARVELRFNPPRKPSIEEHLVISSVSGAAPTVDRPLRGDMGRILDISDGGRRVIFSTSDGFEVIDPQTGATELRHAVRRVAVAAFRADGSIVALAEEGRSTVLVLIVASDGKEIRRSEFTVATSKWGVLIHLESARVALTDAEQGVALYEGDGRALVRLAPEPPDSSSVFRGAGFISPEAVLFTRTGDLLVVGARGLRTVRHDESLVREIPLTADGATLPLAAGRWITGQLESGDIGISQFVKGSYSTMVADPLTGEVRISLAGYRPLVRRGRGGFASASSPGEDSSLRLLQNEDGDIVFLDPGSTNVRLLVKSTREDR